MISTGFLKMLGIVGTMLVSAGAAGAHALGGDTGDAGVPRGRFVAESTRIDGELREIKAVNRRQDSTITELLQQNLDVTCFTANYPAGLCTRARRPTR